MRTLRTLALVAVVVPLLVTCSDDESAAAAGTALVRMKAQYSLLSSAPNPTKALAQAGAQACPPGGPTGTDAPSYGAGLDCDGDGGVATFLTPQRFTVAVRHLVFVKDDGTRLDVVPEAATLAESQVFDLRQEITVDSIEIPGGEYTGFEVEFYYCELRMPINDPSDTQNVRIYLSDDDFASEGSLGHHQGDIVLVDDLGAQIGFAVPGKAWVSDSLLSVRTNQIVGAGGTDRETGHLRGLFGNTSLWNQTTFNQGPMRDVFVYRGPLAMSIDGAFRTVLLTFSVRDSWFWEDFDNDGRFDPCLARDACAANAEWAPLFNPPVAQVQ